MMFGVEYSGVDVYCPVHKTTFTITPLTRSHFKNIALTFSVKLEFNDAT